MCPRSAGILATGFGFLVSAGTVGPIWGASLCPEKSRSWDALRLDALKKRKGATVPRSPCTEADPPRSSRSERL